MVNGIRTRFIEPLLVPRRRKGTTSKLVQPVRKAASPAVSPLPQAVQQALASPGAKVIKDAQGNIIEIRTNPETLQKSTKYPEQGTITIYRNVIFLKGNQISKTESRDSYRARGHEAKSFAAVVTEYKGGVPTTQKGFEYRNQSIKRTFVRNVQTGTEREFGTVKETQLEAGLTEGGELVSPERFKEIQKERREESEEKLAEFRAAQPTTLIGVETPEGVARVAQPFGVPLDVQAQAPQLEEIAKEQERARRVQELTFLSEQEKTGIAPKFFAGAAPTPEEIAASRVQIPVTEAFAKLYEQRIEELRQQQPTSRQEFFDSLTKKIQAKGGLVDTKIIATATGEAVVPESAKVFEGFERQLGTGEPAGKTGQFFNRLSQQKIIKSIEEGFESIPLTTGEVLREEIIKKEKAEQDKVSKKILQQASIALTIGTAPTRTLRKAPEKLLAAGTIGLGLGVVGTTATTLIGIPEPVTTVAGLLLLSGATYLSIKKASKVEGRINKAESISEDLVLLATSGLAAGAGSKFVSSRIGTIKLPDTKLTLIKGPKLGRGRQIVFKPTPKRVFVFRSGKGALPTTATVGGVPAILPKGELAALITPITAPKLLPLLPPTSKFFASQKLKEILSVEKLPTSRQIRKDIIAKYSIKPLDISPRGAFALEIPPYSKFFPKQKLKELFPKIRKPKPRAIRKQIVSGLKPIELRPRGPFAKRYSPYSKLFEKQKLKELFPKIRKPKPRAIRKEILLGLKPEDLLPRGAFAPKLPKPPKVEIKRISTKQLRRQIRRDIIGRLSIRPLDISARGAFAKQLPLYEPPSLKRLRQLESLRKAREKNIRDLIEGQLKLTPRVRTSLRRRVRKELFQREKTRIEIILRGKFPRDLLFDIKKLPLKTFQRIQKATPLKDMLAKPTKKPKIRRPEQIINDAGFGRQQILLPPKTKKILKPKVRRIVISKAKPFFAPPTRGKSIFDQYITKSDFDKFADSLKFKGARVDSRFEKLIPPKFKPARRFQGLVPPIVKQLQRQRQLNKQVKKQKSLTDKGLAQNLVQRQLTSQSLRNTLISAQISSQAQLQKQIQSQESLQKNQLKQIGLQRNRLDLRQRYKQIITFEPLPPPPPPPPPGILFPDIKLKESKVKSKKFLKRSFKYQPQLIAVAKKIKGKRFKVLTGIAIERFLGGK